MALLIITTILWAFSFSFYGEYLAGHVDSYFAVLVRVGLAALVFLPFLRTRGNSLKTVGLYMLVGAMQLGVMYMLSFRAYLYLTVSELLLFTVLTPLYITLIYDIMSKRRLRWGRILALLVAIALCVALVFGVRAAFFTPEEGDATVAQSVSEPLVSDADKAGFDATINSDSAILINADNGDVLYEKDADTQRAPASLVKMMTAYVAIRNTDNIDRELQMPEDAYDGLEEEKASQSGLQKDETVTVRDLLYATLLKSGGDAANALALATSGNIESFVELMNAEAQDLGLDSTVFTNPTGLDDAKQVSTCRDMARLLKGALGNTTFREVFTSREYTTTANETHEEGLTLTHTMDKDLTTFQRYFDTSGYEIVGGKTGYTTNAGNCLASLAEKEGEPNYIVVTMHATGTGDQYYQAVHDAVTLYGEAYDR